MKLSKMKKDGGYTITVIIASREHESYWTSPQIYGVDKNNSYDFPLEYIRERYPIINTKERAATFSRLYKNLWIEVTEEQLSEMQHCIGVSLGKKPYRNRFFTAETDKDWNDLVEKGLAIKGEQHPNDDENIYFWLSQQGVEYVLCKSISDKFYNDL